VSSTDNKTNSSWWNKKESNYAAFDLNKTSVAEKEDSIEA